jgi:hypothetical protein
MQVFGLPSRIIRSSKLASRIVAHSSNNEAAIRRGLWLTALATRSADNPSASLAANGRRATVHRWQKRSDLRSPSKRDPAVSYVLGRTPS